MDECGLPQIWPPNLSFSFTSLLDISVGRFLLNNYLMGTSFALGPENTYSSDTLGILSTLMKFIFLHGLLHQPSDWFPYLQLIAFKSILHLLLVWVTKNTNHIMLIPFRKHANVFSSPGELNFLFVDMAVKVFINCSQLTTSASYLTSSHLTILSGQPGLPWSCLALSVILPLKLLITRLA